MRLAFLSLLLLAGCAHHPETTVQLAAPTAGSWVVRDTKGERLCALPCKVELDSNESVVVSREGGSKNAQAFVVEQSSLGRGTWTGAVHTWREPSTGALALRAFSGALFRAGDSFIDSHPHRDGKVATGLVLTGLGAGFALASDAFKGDAHEELRLQKLSND